MWRKPPAKPAWPTDNSPPPVLTGKIAFIGQIVGVDEFAAVALFAVTEIFDLDHHRDRIVVVDFEQVDIFALHFGKNFLADDFHAEGSFVRQHVGDLIVNLFGVGHQINELVGNLFGFFFRSQNECIRRRSKA